MTSNTLSLVLEGVVSGSAIVESIVVRSLNGSGAEMDLGTLLYLLSCRDSSNTSSLNNCRTCYANGSCVSCYSADGFYLNASSCVTDCGYATAFLTYPSNSSFICTSCTGNCYTCTSATACLTCLASYYYYQNQSCLSFCDPAGHVVDPAGSIYCRTCYGTDCVACSSAAIGACTACSSASVLASGICLANCSSPTMYPSGGVCYNCDSSCATCSSAGNSGCTKCASSYYTYLGFCLATCPTGTAPNLATATCSCHSVCALCENSTTYCTACSDGSLFVSQGQCLTACPEQTYISGQTCVPCSTACISCSVTTCSACLANHFLFNNACYSDCNLVSQQHDQQGSTCVLCPQGCDTCSSTTCRSCLDQYTLSSEQCLRTCLLTSSCDLAGQAVLPLPGLIAVVLWTAIAVAIRLLLKQNYLPYSLILFTAVVQFWLVIAMLASAPNLTSYASRLLVPSNQERLIIRALLGSSLLANYLSNTAYLLVFWQYLHPLMASARQTDSIAHAVTLLLATLTNYRLGLIAFSRMFPKPHLHISNPSKLTPVHYLCLASLLLDLLPLVACGVALYNEQSATILFMFALDLLILLALNLGLTLWFVTCAKDDAYYGDGVKKYHIEDRYGTNETVAGNDKAMNLSNWNMGAVYNFEDEEGEAKADKATPLDVSYQKLQLGQSKASTHLARPRGITTDESAGEDSLVIPVRGSTAASPYDPFSDPNYESGLEPKLGGRGSQNIFNIPTRDHPDPIDEEGRRSAEDGLQPRRKPELRNFSKQPVSARGPATH